MKSVLSILAPIIGLGLNTYPRIYFQGDKGGTLFCKYQAVSFLFILLAGRITCKEKLNTIFWDFVGLLAIGNAADEIWNVAESFTNSEKIFAVIVTAWTIYRLNKCRKNNG